MRAEEDVYVRLVVYRPAVAVEQRREIALRKFHRRDNHRRQRNCEQHADYPERHPHAELYERADNHAERRRNAAYGNAESGDSADVDFLRFLVDDFSLFETRRDVLVGGKRALCNLLARPFEEAFVGREERLRYADWVVDNLRYGCVPIASVAVVEDAVFADNQVVRIARGDDGDDVQIGLALALADAVEQVAVRHRSHRRMLCNVVNLYAERAHSAVDVEPAELENRVGFVLVKFLKADEIAQQRTQTFVEPNELFEFRDFGDLGGDCGVGFERGKKRGRLVLCKNFAQARLGDFRAGGVRIRTEPRGIRRKYRLYFEPVCLRNRGHSADGLCRIFGEVGKSLAPHGVDVARKVERIRTRHERNGQIRQRAATVADVFGQDFREAFRPRIDYRSRGLVEAHDVAPRKEVVDFVLHGGERSVRAVGGSPERRSRERG